MFTGSKSFRQRSQNRGVFILSKLNRLDDFNAIYTFKTNDALKKISQNCYDDDIITTYRKLPINVDMEQIKIVLLQEEHILPAGAMTNMKMKYTELLVSKLKNL